MSIHSFRTHFRTQVQQRASLQFKMAAATFQQILDLEDEEDDDFMFQLFIRAFEQGKRKRKHKFWVHPILLKRKTLGSYHHLVQELQLHGTKFQEYFRMSVTQFEELLSVVGPHLQKTARNREPITAAQRLAICLR